MYVDYIHGNYVAMWVFQLQMISISAVINQTYGCCAYIFCPNSVFPWALAVKLTLISTDETFY